MFATFLKPVWREFALAFVLVALALGLGRFWALDGGLWTWAGLIISGLLFASAANYWPKLYALDVPARRWLSGALIIAAAWSVVMGTIASASALIMQRISPYYAWYDWFMNTEGPARHTDTNGEEYYVLEMGITAASIAWTLLISILAFLIFTVLGIAVGVSLRRWPQLLTLIGAGVIALVLLMAASGYLSWAAYHQAENPEVVVPPIDLESWQRFLLVLAVAAAPIAAAWWTIRRSIKTPWD